MARKRSDAELAAKIRQCVADLDRAKRYYKRADARMAELLREMTPGQVVALNQTGKTATLVDKLPDGKPGAFHGSFFRRYELEVSEN